MRFSSSSGMHDDASQHVVHQQAPAHADQKLELPSTAQRPSTEQCESAGHQEGAKHEAMKAHVLLQYVVVYQPLDDRTIEETCSHYRVLGEVAVFGEVPFRMEVPAKRLVSTYQGIAGTDRASHGVAGTYLRAQVTCFGANNIESFAVYSPEMYVCNDRNLRKRSYRVQYAQAGGLYVVARDGAEGTEYQAHFLPAPYQTPRRPKPSLPRPEAGKCWDCHRGQFEDHHNDARRCCTHACKRARTHARSHTATQRACKHARSHTAMQPRSHAHTHAHSHTRTHACTCECVKVSRNWAQRSTLEERSEGGRVPKCVGPQFFQQA